jgi:hypothetical protein
LRIQGPGGRQTIEAILDTGFNGLLSLPPSTIRSLGTSSEWEERRVRELMMQDRDYLTADDLEQRLRRRSVSTEPVDTERLVRRIEHLETIVTSRDWDHVSTPESDALSSEQPDDAEEAADLARRVR